MKKLQVKSPFDQSIVGEVEISSKEQVQSAIDEAYGIFVDFKKRLPKYEIAKILSKTAKLISEQKEELTILCASEGGKPYMDSKVEIERAINGIEFALSYLGALEGKEIAMGHTLSSANRMAYTFKEPIGVVAAISAFNHPFNLAVHQVIPAIAVGCPVIIKPASSTPLSAFKLIEILESAGLPKGYARAIMCDRESAELLATSEKTAFLTFIGSNDVGWSLNKKASDGTRVALEHGGVAPVIVEKDADFDELLPALLKGGFYHAGQVCVSVQRVYVQEDIAREVGQKLADMAKKLKVGNQLDRETEVGPLISHKDVDRVNEWVKDAQEKGGQILCGGNKISNSLYEPTVIFDTSDEAIVSKKEVFGPVVCVYPYKNIDEAIARSNSLSVSFQGAVFTKNIDKALKVVKQMNATAVMVNDHTAFRVDWMPFGGAKTSGLGLGGINYSMDEMCNEKLMVIKSPSI
ncbi:MAG: aldehyde dehydrogenase [Proteobacteria bacterium]|nr:MAG: aldehyde dehydrogenase [Pseudomonadota bacterium]